VAGSVPEPCAACPVDRPSACVGQARRRLELVRLFAALRPLRIAPWPYPGPIGIKERGDLHVVDRWQFLGTARSDTDLHAVLEARPRAFDPRLQRLLDRTLARLPRHRIVDLSAWRQARLRIRAPDRAA